ncbi:MAG TPA: hypothetical protein VJM09_14575 [Sphingobium sp.]|nr:hypothetical protein [Sphingobium sp.]
MSIDRIRVASAIAKGMVIISMAGDALYFPAAHVAPDWPLQRVTRIGRHISYR